MTIVRVFTIDIKTQTLSSEEDPAEVSHEKVSSWKMFWLAWILLLARGGTSKHCSIQEKGFLAQSNGKVIWSTPIHLKLIEEQLNSIQKEVEYKQQSTDTHEVNWDGRTFTFSIPVEADNSITLARGKCMELEGHSSSLENILKSGLHERYTRLTSVSFLMKTKNGIKCNINGKESETKCWRQVEDIRRKYNMKTNTSNMRAFLETHQLGLLNTKGSEIVMTTGMKCRLPCITSTKAGKSQTKWSLLRDNYLKPIAERAVKILKRIKKATHDKRRKRSLFSSIFGLASAAETENIRAALRVELDNQQRTNKAMSNLLRNQIKTAKQIRKEDKILYKLETEELKLEKEVDSLKSFLEKAFSNNTEMTTRLQQDNMAILKAFTLSQRLTNVENQLSTILDILHCPAGRCKRILEEVMEEQNIGEKDTLNLIADLVQTHYNKDRIEVVMDNITKTDRVVHLKCIPFLTSNQTVRLKYNHEIAINKKGFYTLPPTCIRTIGLTLCPQQMTYFKDKCLESLIHKRMANNHCGSSVVGDRQTIQDFISDQAMLHVYSRVKDKVLITSENFQERSELNIGINTFQLKKSEVEIETSHMYFKVGRDNDKQLTSETITLAKYDPKQEGNITEQSNVNIDTAELENIMIPKLSLDTNMDKFELSETILPNPTLVFLSKPEESWYVYLVMVVSALTMLIGMTIYCKCKKKLCFKMRHGNRVRVSENRTRESESEEQIRLVEQIPKYCEMTLENLGFCKEIITLQKGKKYFWSGSSWRDQSNRMEPSFREPPSYLLGELKTFSGGCMVGMKENNPYIHMKDFPETNYNRALGCWELNSEGTTRTLPSYAAPRPKEEILHKFRKTLIEHKTNLNM